VFRITDFQPALRDNESDYGSKDVCPSPKTAIEAAPIPFWDAL